MEKLNSELYEQVKQAFMPMQGEPVAGAGPMTHGLMAPMGGAEGGMPPMDPGMDPAMAGAPPMDPGMDPAMAGGDPGMAGGDPGMMDPAMLGQMLAQEGGAVAGQITMNVDDLVKLVQGIAAAIKPPKAPAAPAPEEAGMEPGMDPAMAGAPPMDPGMAGMPPGAMPPPGVM